MPPCRAHKPMHSALLAAALLLGLACSAAAAQPDAQQVDCAALGFTGLALCSDCTELGTFVKDEELVIECRRCCAEESTKEETKFSTAVLEVCPHSLRSFPHIETFVDKKAKDFANLKVRMKYGAAPRLILRNSGQPATNVRIDGWKTEHIEEYLADKLQGGRGAAAA